MLEVVEIDIDDNVIISCPKLNFKQSFACKICPACEHFNGIGLMSDAGQWSDKYIIRCAHIIERRTTVIE